MRDLISGDKIESLHDFNSIFAPADGPLTTRVQAELMRNAYEALVALERGRREEYLRLRRLLAERYSAREEPSEPYFRQDDVVSEFSWPNMMIVTLPAEAAALGFEAEESSWETIAPGQSRLCRMLITEEIWRQALNDSTSNYGRAVINMMDFRFGQVISTGSSKQPLISILLASHPDLRSKFVQAIAKHEQVRLTAAIRRQRRAQAVAESVKTAPERPGPSTGDEVLPMVQPEVSSRL